MLWAGLIIFSTVNAVNVTDGLDGLAAGSALFGFFAFTVIAFWGFRNPELYPFIVNPFDLVDPRRRPGRCLRRLPVVERRTGADLHG